MKVLEIENINLQYGTGEILKKVSFDTQKGDFISIIGPNGSGKTSLLKAIAGITPICGGEIRLHQKDISKISRKEMARQIAVVPQQNLESSLFTVMETVLMGRTPHLSLVGIETQHDYEQARSAMRFTDVEHLAERRISELSGGERQRVTIARAICQEAEIILLDEPTSALDFSHQVRIMDLMQRMIEDKQTTIIMISHDLNLSAMYSNRILVLKDGKILKVGTPGEVLTKEVLLKAFGCQMHVSSNPFFAVPRVLPVPGRFQDK